MDVFSGRDAAEAERERLEAERAAKREQRRLEGRWAAAENGG